LRRPNHRKDKTSFESAREEGAFLPGRILVRYGRISAALVATLSLSGSAAWGAATGTHRRAPLAACKTSDGSAARREKRYRPLLKEKKMREGWELTFHDEFAGDQLDRSKWEDQYWHGRTHSNNERQYYAPDGYETKDGKLRFKGEKREMGGMPYTSGMISSLGHFSQTYGYFEMRAKFPSGKGYWPAFWLLPVTKQWPPEIDILEILGHEPNKIYFTTHWRDEQGKHQGKGGNFVGPDFSKDFHTFGLEWSPGECVWYVDGEERYRSTAGIPSEPMYVIANLAIGGDWPGNPDASTRFPGYMEIDYIRVYRKKA
jgi:beta-glucanase (GH16 family)